MCPPCYALDCAVLGWNLAQQLTWSVTPVVIKQTSEKRLLLLIQVWLSVLIKHGTGQTIALEVDDKSLDVESYSLVSVNRQKRTSPRHFLRNPIFGVIFTTERLLSMPQIKGSGKEFSKFLVQPTCGWLDLLASLSFFFPSLLYCYTQSLVRMNTKQLYLKRSKTLKLTEKHNHVLQLTKNRK